MKRHFLAFVFFIASLGIFAQKNDRILVKINNDEITVSEFKKVFEKNLNLLEDEKEKSIENNLNLYVNFKLKVQQAYQLHLDTLKSYKREIETYQNQLTAPYLQDKKFLEKLIREAYHRTKYEINASHILVKIIENASPADTLKAFKKITAARNRILKGESFEKVAVEVSEDPSVKSNKGNLGYFGAFKMLYDFENKAFKTKVGEISQPLKTRFGYHIIKVNDKRLSQGEVQTAHILITDTSSVGKKRIDSVYQLLKKGENFKELVKKYSNDISTKRRGGSLPRFGAGRMVKPFEDAAFGIEKEGDFSKPFKTSFGWHIVKLIKKFPVLEFDEMKDEISDRIKRTGRAKLSDQAVINKLKSTYKVLVNQNAKKILNNKNIRSLPTDSLQLVLLTINEKNINQKIFVDYLQNRRHRPVSQLFEMFKNEQIILYFKENLVNTEPEFASTLKEYKDGLLLFELMKRKVWDKSIDSIALKDFYNQRAQQYRKPFKEVRGKVMSDYQTYLDEKWIADLRSKNKVKVNKKVLKKLEKYYSKPENE